MSSIIFFGIISAGSMIMLVESAKNLKLFVGRCGLLIDVLLFILSAIAVATLGVTVAGGLAVASLLFTIYRVNFLGPWYKGLNIKFRTIGSYVAQGFNSVIDFLKDPFNFKKISNETV